MKLKNKSFEDVIVGAEKEMDFSIDTDNHLIFEILRDKMYKDKIGSICREVLSNSRDANRESGSKENVSVTIIEPNQIIYVGHQSVSFKDNGIGITPDRMASIYVKYASSTKTGSDKETGGFGLGAKTPFAYNDTFTVVTVCDVDGKRMKYFYTALIDSSRKGKMILFDSEETTENTGTEVIVPIKTPEDRHEFETKAFYYSKYWGCVDYVGFNITTDIPEVIKETEDYLVADNTDGTFMIIDGIPYPLESNWGFENLSLQNDYSIGIKFNTGDLTISANRESVQYDKDTVDVITSKTVQVKEEFIEILDDMINNFPTYLAACKFKSKLDDGFFPDFDKGTMNYVIAAAIGTNHYSRHMLTDTFKNRTIQFEGRDVVSKIKFEHHTIERVRDKGYNSYSKAKIYKAYETLPLKQLSEGEDDIYLNTGAKSSRRNDTIFSDEDNSKEYFWMLTKKTLSSEVDANLELERMEDDFGMTWLLYKDVVPMPVERKKRSASKIGATHCRGYYNVPFDLYYSATDKMLYHDEDGDDPVDLTNKVFVGVERVTTRRGWASGFPTQDDVASIKENDMKVIFINYTNFEKKIKQVKGAKLMKPEMERIIKTKEKKWIKEARQFVVNRTIYDVSSNLLEYIAVLPDNILPEYIKSFKIKDINKAEDFQKSYNRVKDKLKVDRAGLTGKLESNLAQYPMLKSFIAYEGVSKENLETVEQYIKQVENYGK